MTATTSFSLSELEQQSRSFESSHPLDIMRWAADRFGDGLVAT